MDQEIYKGFVVLQKNEILLYPTDTVWGIGCDATDFNAVSRIFEIKKRSESKSLIILVSSIHMLKKYVSVSNYVLNFLKTTTKPTTVIYQNPKGIADNVIANDNTVAIRIVQDDFCRKLIKRFGKPIVSTSANISGEPTPKSYSKIQKPILDSVDYVVNLHRKRTNTQPSSIVKVEKDGSIYVIRD